MRVALDAVSEQVERVFAAGTPEKVLALLVETAFLVKKGKESWQVLSELEQAAMEHGGLTQGEVNGAVREGLQTRHRKRVASKMPAS